MSHFAEAACLRNERVLYFSFEESPSQITRNMLSAGINLQKYIKKGLLYIESKRASQFSLDVHLLEFEKSIEMHKPNIVIIDPISSLMDIASQYDLKRALIKLVDYLHINDITIMIGSLVSSNDALLDSSSIAISSLVDSWILLRDVESYGERNRAMYIRKSRGMSHSNKVREFIITDHGIVIKDIFANNEGVLVGGAREAGIVKKDTQEILLKEALDQDIIKNLSNIKMLREQIIDIGHALTELEASNLIVINQQSQRKAPGIVARLSKPIKERPR
jgi:circadian clock protein KaiC